MEEAPDVSQTTFANSLSAFDPKLIPSIAESLKTMQSVGAIEAVKTAGEALAPFNIVAPQVAAAFRAVQMTAPTDAFRAIAEAPAFNFTKTLEGLDISGAVPLLPEMFASIDPKAFGSILNLEPLPPVVTAELASGFDHVAQEAVALAEVDEVTSQVEDAARTEWDELSPAERRENASSVLALVVAALLLAAWLSENEAFEGAGRLLAFAAALIAYWQLSGRNEE